MRAIGSYRFVIYQNNCACNGHIVFIYCLELVIMFIAARATLKLSKLTTTGPYIPDANYLRFHSVLFFFFPLLTVHESVPYHIYNCCQHPSNKHKETSKGVSCDHNVLAN